MNSPRVIHPSREDLKAFGLGKLSPATADTILQHLETCEACRGAVAESSEDSFLGRLREARKPDATVIPGRPAFGHGRSQNGPAPTTGSPRADSLPPELADNSEYQDIVELGRGGMGVVYKAHNILMGRDEVLKVMGKELLSRPGAIDRFRREIQSAARLNHPKIVRAYSARLLGDLLVFSMEYVPGDELAKLVKARGPLPVAHASYYVRQVADGLQHAHENGMVHRDIKPANLILSVDPDKKKFTVKILDFGLAKMTSETGYEGGLTGEGRMLGTPDYIAPEQILDAQSADIRADIYSLGCTLYFLLAGRPPFQASSLYELLRQHREVDAQPLNFIRPEVPAELASVVRKMMAKDPAKRFQTPAEVMKALAPFVKPGAVAAKPRKELSQAEMATVNPPLRAGEEVTLPAKPQPTQLVPPQSLPAPVLVSRAANEWGTLITDSTNERPAAKKPASRRKVKWRRSKWMWPVGFGAALLLLLGVLWASGQFNVKSRDGNRVSENLATTDPTKLAEDPAARVAANKTPKGELGSVNPVVLPVETVQKFEYMIEGEKKSGECRVLTLDIGGGEKMEFVRIGKGKFMMGSPNGEKERSNDEEQHEVEISKDFYLGKYTVTQAQYKAIVGENPSIFKGDRLPVEMVSWEDAANYCEALSKKLNRKFSLPSEAQWEYACRAGTKTPFHFGSKLKGDLANHDGNYPYGTDTKGPYKQKTVEVGSYLANPWGLYDMHGNVYQWCQDYYGPYQKLDGTRDPIQLLKQSDNYHVLRGGSWFCHAWFCRAADRNRSVTDGRLSRIGFRVCLALDKSRTLSPSDAAVQSIVSEFNVPPIKLDSVETALADLPFDPKVMKDYESDLAIDEILKDKERYKLQARTLEAFAAIRKIWAGNGVVGTSFRRELMAPVTSNTKKAIFKDLEVWAVAIAELELVSAKLDEVAGMKEFQAKRWQAHYEYARAVVKSRLAHMNEYSKVLGDVRTETLPPLEKGQNHYRLVSSEKMRSKVDVKKLVEEAQEAYTNLMTQHKDTPWAVQAKREKGTPLGLFWSPGTALGPNAPP